jgi:pyrrolidone-carboxylate peptidase
MITGYWPPTNEMLRQFSNNPVQNPDGWVGADWEGRGYNIYSYFPEFPGGLGKGEGDFEVDYQDTSTDFWAFVDLLDPIALITTGRAGADRDWEVEDRHSNRSTWSGDYLDPRQPTPSPPDDTVPAYTTRFGTLPMQEIVDAVNAEPGINVLAYIASDFGGSFLCEYIGYHACWYHDLHADPEDPAWLVASGHIHVGSVMSEAEATTATEITLRELTSYLDQVLPCPGDLDGDRVRDLTDFTLFASAYGSVLGETNYDPAADMDGDGVVDLTDFGLFAAVYGVACP